MRELPLANPADIDRLAADLRDCAYDADHVPALLGPDAHHALGRGYRQPALHVTSQASADGLALATVTRLFLLGTSERASTVAAALPTLGVDRGLQCGVLEDVPDTCVPTISDSSATTGASATSAASSTDRLLRAAIDIRPHANEHHSYLVISDFDTDTRPGPVPADHVLGIGAASITLANAVIRQPVGRVLDIGTGCGIQALHCAGHAESITVTDTNPRALAIAAATARLNGLSWDIRRGSLFNPVAGEQFDLIVANPPFVISAGAQRFAYRDSGMPGDQLCEQLVTALPQHLAPGGTAQLLANWMIRDDGDWRQRVASWVAGTGLDGWVVQREVARPAEYVSLWLADAGEADSHCASEGDGAGGGASAEQCASDWLDYFAREHVTGIGMGTITLRKPIRARGGVPDVVFDELTAAGDQLTGPEVDAFLARRAYLADTSDDDLLATTMSLAPDNLLQQRLLPSDDGWTPVLRMLYRPGGPGASVQLDEWGQAIFAGCRGTVPLGVQFQLLATARGVDPDALAQALLPTIRVAITRGLLHPVETTPIESTSAETASADIDPIDIGRPSKELPDEPCEP